MFKSSAYLMDAYVFFNKWQTTSKNAYLLVGDDIKRIFGSSNQLHFNVVSSSNRGHYIQVSLKDMLKNFETWVTLLVLKLATCAIVVRSLSLAL